MTEQARRPVTLLEWMDACVAAEARVRELEETLERISHFTGPEVGLRKAREIAQAALGFRDTAEEET